MKKYKINVIKWNLEKYNSSPLFFQKFQILLLMENANTHLVSIFKDFLLFDDSTEFLKEYYEKEEIYPRLKTIYDYYESSSYLFPNYTAINEGKYIYRNIIKKQKLIDYLEDLEDKIKEKEEKEKLKKKQKIDNKNQNEKSSSYIEVFNSKIYENIRKETENDSKINELLCLENKNNNDYDSLTSILKLTEEIKEKEKKIEVKKNNNLKGNSIKKDKDSNSNNKKINYNFDNMNKDEDEGKIYVSKKISINQNSKVYNKKTIYKGIKKLNINKFINNNGLISKGFNLTERNRKINPLNIELNKKDDNIINTQKAFNSNKNIKKCYKKNNIIINIINNNKNKNYNSGNNCLPNYPNTNENNIDNNNNYVINFNFKTDNDKVKDNPRINSENNNIENKNSNISIRNFKNILAKNQNISNNKNNENQNIQKNNKKKIKTKLLSFRINDSYFIRNLTERIKVKSNSSSIQKNKKKSKTKSKYANNYENINNHNKKKRTKTEIFGNKADIFIFGHQQQEINPYNGSLNRQILKNINSTNNSKPHKDISLVNKKIINYHFNLNNILNNSNKFLKHNSIHSQNLTENRINNKLIPFSAHEGIKKKGLGIFSVNKTERTSRNHSKGKINKINNTTVKKKYLDSFSPIKTQDLIYNKINKIKNSKNKNIYIFMQNKKIQNIKNIKNKSNNNYSNIIHNNSNYQGVNTKNNNNYKNKELHKRINSGKIFKIY